MKLQLFVTNSVSGGGAELATNLLCEELTKLDLRVCLFPIRKRSNDPVTTFDSLSPILPEGKLSIFSVGLGIFRFRKILRDVGPSSVILNCSIAELLGCFISTKSIGLYVVEHSSDPWWNHRLVGKIVRHFLGKRVRYWVRVSDHIEPWHTSSANVLTIPNMVRQVSPAQDLASSKLLQRLVYVGRLSEEKRPELLLHAAAAIKLEVVFIGDGRLKPGLEELAVNSGVNVTFKGHVDDPWTLVKQGDLLVIPSGFEGDGLVLIEALQSRIPLLVSKIDAFYRFNLRADHYFDGILELVEKIEHFRNSLDSLCVDEAKVKEILVSRNPKTIAQAWASLIVT